MKSNQRITIMEVILQNQENKMPFIFKNDMNKAFITGRIAEEFEFSHQTKGKSFYRNKVRVKRKSGIDDIVPIMAEERFIESARFYKDCYVEICGEFRSYLLYDKRGKYHVHLFLFVNSIDFCYENQLEADRNVIYLEGVLNKKPIYRKTPYRNEISDIIVKSDRIVKDHFDYIPCVTWKGVAWWTKKNLKMGDRVHLYGRIQSRLYFKKDSPSSNEGVYHEVYEVSVGWIEKLS